MPTIWCNGSEMAVDRHWDFLDQEQELPERARMGARHRARDAPSGGERLGRPDKGATGVAKGNRTIGSPARARFPLRPSLHL
jgi:hypothetical protein